MKNLIEDIKSRFDNVEAIVSGFSMSVIWASPKLHKLLDYKEGELTDISINKLIKLNPLSITKMIADAVNDEASDTNKIIKKDGSEILLKTTAGITKYDNEPYIVVTGVEELKE